MHASDEVQQANRERWRLLRQIDQLLEMPMVVLGFAWLALLIWFQREVPVAAGNFAGDFDRFTDAFIVDAIEAHGLVFGGGGSPTSRELPCLSMAP